MKSYSILLHVLVIVLLCSCKSNDSKKETVKDVNNIKVTKDSITVQQYFDAALEGHSKIVSRAVESGIPVDTINENRSTAMMLAAFHGHATVVEYLIDKGANVNHRDVNNRTALMYASSGPALETVKLLLQSGADVNSKDNVEGFTALMFAAAEGQTEVFKALLNAGADVSMKDSDGETARDFALNNGHSEIVDLTTNNKIKK